MKLYRIIDANINRVSEGLRVLEDISRFLLEKNYLSKEFRQLRHLVRKTLAQENLLSYRNSTGDLGLKISQSTNIDNKKDINSLIKANAKRVQEGLRSIEEVLKVLGKTHESKNFERMRFKSYSLERSLLLNKSLPQTDIYGILGQEFSNGKSNIDVTKEMIQAEIKIIQYREKNKSKLSKYKECKLIKEMASTHNVFFIVNDDVDIALAVDADGIHIGQDDLPIGEVKKLAPDKVIGLSTHNPTQAMEAINKGADYIGVGPIFNTSTKSNVEKSDGLNYLKWVSENITIPYVAIGGITECNILTVKKSGGKCFAMISEIVGSKDIVKKVASIRNIL